MLRLLIFVLCRLHGGGPQINKWYGHRYARATASSRAWQEVPCHCVLPSDLPLMDCSRRTPILTICPKKTSHRQLRATATSSVFPIWTRLSGHIHCSSSRCLSSVKIIQATTSLLSPVWLSRALPVALSRSRHQPVNHPKNAR